MIRKLRMWGARGLFLLVVAAGLGFGILVAAMAAVTGGLMLLGVRLAASTAPAAEPAAPSPGTGTGAQPA